MIAVVGINGSGTSAMTGLLNRLGVDFAGPYEYGPNYEHIEIRRINDRLLDGLCPTPPRGPLRQIPDYDEICALTPLESWQVPDVNWKDPKGSITLPVWRYLVDHVVWVRRGPMGTARNLRREYGIEDEEAYSLISIYHDRIHRAVHDFFRNRYYVIHYEELYQHLNAGRVQGLLRFCGHDIDWDQIYREIRRVKGPRPIVMEGT